MDFVITVAGAFLTVFIMCAVRRKFLDLKEKNRILLLEKERHADELETLVYGMLFQIVGVRKEEGAAIDIRKIPGPYIRSDAVGNHRSLCIEIFSREKSHPGLRREIYVWLFPSDWEISLTIDGREVFSRENACIFLPTICRLVQGRMKNMGLGMARVST